MAMTRYDLSPLFRSTVGFDRLARVIDAATRVDDTALTYPPYNIEKTGEDAYRVTLAVAGFSTDDIDIVVHENTLTVASKAKEDEAGAQYLHRGIARRAFERRFQLADHIKVTAANLVNGLLSIDLVREVPEQLKPRKIAISATEPAAPPAIEQQAAA
jgi:molecular chaperone IbpA